MRKKGMNDRQQTAARKSREKAGLVYRRRLHWRKLISVRLAAVTVRAGPRPSRWAGHALACHLHARVIRSVSVANGDWNQSQTGGLIRKIALKLALATRRWVDGRRNMRVTITCRRPHILPLRESPPAVTPVGRLGSEVRVSASFK